MKRSEATLSLSDKLQKSQNLLDGYRNGSIDLKCLCDNLATRAVDYCVNELGMLPPTRKVKETRSGYNQFGEQSGTYTTLYDRNQWEPEDEA